MPDSDVVEENNIYNWIKSKFRRYDDEIFFESILRCPGNENETEFGEYELVE